jgi:phage portal protein BeeE
VVRIFGIQIGRDNEAKAVTAADVRAEILGQGTSKTGARVDWKTALQITTAFACARVIADGLAQVPFRVYRDLTNGGKEAATDHQLYGIQIGRAHV